MSNPTFPRINGQIRTTLRWYDSEVKKNANQRECIEEMEACPYKLLTPPDSLLPFQLTRLNSVEAITSWGIYDSEGSLVYDLTADLDLINIRRFTTYDYLTYSGEVISELMDEGSYHSRIVTGGTTYFSEDFFVPCPTYNTNALTDPPFDGGLQSEANADAIWVLLSWARQVYQVKNTAGAPTDPLLENEGYQVINTAENLLYTYTGGSWVSSTPSASTGWYDYDSGNWYRFQGGVWEGLVNDPITVDENGICFDGVSFPGTGPTISTDIGSLTCTEVVARMEFTVEGMTQGQLNISMEGYGGLAITEDGTHSFQTYIANGYLWHFTPSLNFDGCVTSAKVYCPAAMEDCFTKLSWTNCGNVGNTYYPDDFVQAFYLPGNAPRPVPQPEEDIESQEQEDGSVTPVFKRKNIRWTQHIGEVPWYVADALSDAVLHDTVTLNVPNETGSGSFFAATLINPSILVEQDKEVSECMFKVTLTFEVDNTAVACCDTFDAPCLVKCVDAFGFDDETPLENDQYYVFRNQPRFAYYTGDAFQPYDVCTSGLANIVDELGSVLYTAYWEVNTFAWVEVAVNTLDDLNAGDPCTMDLRWTVAEGYRGILQFTEDPEVDPFEDVADDAFDLSADEWSQNATPWETIVLRGFIRLRVYVNECTLGYSRIIEFDCEV